MTKYYVRFVFEQEFEAETSDEAIEKASNWFNESQMCSGDAALEIEECEDDGQ